MSRTSIFRLASATVIGTGLLFATPALADIIYTEPLPIGPVSQHLVVTESIDSTVKNYVRWLAGRPARKEAARLAALTKTAISYGPLPPASVIACESKGSYTAENPVSSASGRYQIVDGTWNGYGGYSHASHAPPHVQDAKARELWAGGAGRGHWRQCL